MTTFELLIIQAPLLLAIFFSTLFIVFRIKKAKGEVVLALKKISDATGSMIEAMGHLNSKQDKLKSSVNDVEVMARLNNGKLNSALEKCDAIYLGVNSKLPKEIQDINKLVAKIKLPVPQSLPEVSEKNVETKPVRSARSAKTTPKRS